MHASLRVGGTAGRIAVIMALCGMAAVPHAAVFAAPPGNIAGRVTASDGTPLPGATVSAAGKSAVTDTAGSYLIRRVQDGTQTVTASKIGYNASSVQVTVRSRETVTAPTITLQITPPSFGAITGRVTSAANGAAIAGASVVISGTTLQRTTDSGGNYFFDRVPAGTQTLSASASGYQTQTQTITVAGLDGSFLADIDRALAIAASRRVYIVFSVMDNIMWAPASYSGTVQMGGRPEIITDPSVRQSFFDNALRPLLQHIAASPHRNIVLAYDIVSEPEKQMRGYWGGIGLEPASVQEFVRIAASYIHAYGGGAYATVDSAMPAYTATWKNLGLDFYQFHYYPWMDFGGAAGSGLPAYASLGLDRPAVVSEFQTVNPSYAQGDATPLSAQWYLDTIYKYGYAGALAWSYRAGDVVSNWSAFRPVFSVWAQKYAAYTGPR